MNVWTISLDIKRMVITIKTYLVQRVLSWKHYYAQILFKNISENVSFRDNGGQRFAIWPLKSLKT